MLKLQYAWPPKYHPVVGPIYVEVRERGDTLVVEFDWIDPWHYGFSGILTGIGPLGDSLKWQECAEPRDRVHQHRLAEGGALARPPLEVDGRLHVDEGQRHEFGEAAAARPAAIARWRACPGR